MCDFLLAIGMKPLIELGFMPRCLASGTETVFHYQGNITPPNDFEAWGELIKRLAQHLKNRYGAQEVSSWYFEVWNEPNLDAFWAGSQKDYWDLYESSARAIKGVCNDFKVGGPSTAQNAWIPEFIKMCKKRDVPFDFVSTHHYPTDSALGMAEDMEDQMALAPRGIVTDMVKKAREETGQTPLLYTEWNSSPSCRDRYHDGSYAAAFAVKSIVDNSGIVDMYSYWTVSDIFEEVPMPQGQFYGGFGLLSTRGIAKPAYRAFQFLHQMGTQRLPLEIDGDGLVEAVATFDEGQLKILLYQHQVPLKPIQTEQVKIKLIGSSSLTRIEAQIISDDHGHAPSLWNEWGRPDHVTAEQEDALHLASVPLVEHHLINEQSEVELSVPAHGVILLSVF